jgi:tRNA nucleotidyltransferase (CCA-adding enzyme)
VKTTDYLKAVLDAQTLDDDGPELKELRARRDEIETLLREEFGSSPSIRYAGSYAKGTVIRESYDLDIVTYFPRDDSDSGETLKELYENTKKVLEKQYAVEPKPSALRVLGKDKVDFHVDVVPGRFISENSEDVYLYQSGVEKERLKTNINTHVEHVKTSGAVEDIRLAKLWRTRHGVDLKTFVLELAVIDILSAAQGTIDERFVKVLKRLRDQPETIDVKDPANPEGNDLSHLWNETIWKAAGEIARQTLNTIDSSGWEAVFGQLPAPKDEAVARLHRAAKKIEAPARPWCP